MNERDKALEEAAKVCEDWLNQNQFAVVDHVPARTWANDAIKDIADAIRALKSSSSA